MPSEGIRRVIYRLDRKQCWRYRLEALLPNSVRLLKPSFESSLL